MKDVGIILAKMLRSSIDYELTRGNQKQATILRQALTRVMSQYNL